MVYSEKIKLLPDICVLQSGYTARVRLEPTQAEGVPAIQMRDLPTQLTFEPCGLSHYALDKGFDRYWAGPGDVLFRSRGEQNTAIAIVGENPAAIAILPVVIIKPRPDVVDHRYLAWFINQPNSQRHFDRCARGTGLRMIPKTCLESLEIALPDLATQRRIVDVAELALREYELTKALAEKRKALISFALFDQARKTQLHGNGAGQSIARQT